jgi:hypothetical protein
MKAAPLGDAFHLHSRKTYQMIPMLYASHQLQCQITALRCAVSTPSQRRQSTTNAGSAAALESSHTAARPYPIQRVQPFKTLQRCRVSTPRWMGGEKYIHPSFKNSCIPLNILNIQNAANSSSVAAPHTP